MKEDPTLLGECDTCGWPVPLGECMCQACSNVAEEEAKEEEFNNGQFGVGA